MCKTVESSCIFKQPQRTRGSQVDDLCLLLLLLFGGRRVRVKIDEGVIVEDRILVVGEQLLVLFALVLLLAHRPLGLHCTSSAWFVRIRKITLIMRPFEVMKLKRFECYKLCNENKKTRKLQWLFKKVAQTSCLESFLERKTFGIGDIGSVDFVSSEEGVEGQWRNGLHGRTLVFTRCVEGVVCFTGASACHALGQGSLGTGAELLVSDDAPQQVPQNNLHSFHLDRRCRCLTEFF